MVFIHLINVPIFLLWYMKGPYHIKKNNWWNLNIEPVWTLQSNLYFAAPLKLPPEPSFRSDMKANLATRLTDP